jgi:hypothetical protein
MIVPSSVEEGVFLAKMAEEAEQYEDMASFIGPLLGKPEELTVDEKNLVSITFKTICDSKRTAWRAIAHFEQDPKCEPYKSKLQVYKKKVETELKSVCKRAIDTIDNSLYERAKSAETRVFFLKLKGDYFRYMAETLAGPEFEDASAKALENYLNAKKIASESLDAINPARLGLALNLAVFFFEIKKNPKEACQLAKSAVDEAVLGLQTLEEGQYESTTAIMQLLRDNLTSWTVEIGENDESPDHEDQFFS